MLHFLRGRAHSGRAATQAVRVGPSEDVVISQKNSIKNQKVKTSKLGEPLVYYRNFSQWQSYFIEFKKFKLVEACDKERKWTVENNNSNNENNAPFFFQA